MTISDPHLTWRQAFAEAQAALKVRVEAHEKSEISKKWQDRWGLRVRFTTQYQGDTYLKAAAQGSRRQESDFVGVTTKRSG